MSEDLRCAFIEYASQDDTEMGQRTQRSAEDHESKELRRLNEALHKQVDALRKQVQVEAERANIAIAERESLKENLNAELEDTRSHIFALQSYRKDITPKEIGQVS